MSDSDMPIDALDLSVRALNCLKREGIHDLGSLLEHSRADLAEIRNLGDRGIEEIVEKLRERGLALRDDPPDGEPPPGEEPGDEAGDREPRLPAPFGGAGGAAKPVPDDPSQP